MQKPTCQAASAVMLALTLLATQAQAQDALGAMRRMLEGSVGGDVARVFQSITEMSVGSAPVGVVPPDVPPGTVVMFRTASCGYCKAAARHMTERGVPFIERDIQRDPAARRDYTPYRAPGVPLILMGRQVVRGFSAASFDRAYAAEYPDRPRPGPVEASADAGDHRVAVAHPTMAPAAQPRPLQAGDILTAKIVGVPLYALPNMVDAAPQRLLQPGETVVLTGDQQGEFSRVLGATDQGWVRTLLLRRP